MHEKCSQNIHTKTGKTKKRAIPNERRKRPERKSQAVNPKITSCQNEIRQGLREVPLDPVVPKEIEEVAASTPEPGENGVLFA